uniref:Immunoglobulin domain-containing protein n=1 Tax=Oryctolagus cuniculus TaxID=9986 RepID=G1SPS4_RABIT
MGAPCPARPAGLPPPAAAPLPLVYSAPGRRPPGRQGLARDGETLAAGRRAEARGGGAAAELPRAAGFAAGRRRAGAPRRQGMRRRAPRGSRSQRQRALQAARCSAPARRAAAHRDARCPLAPAAAALPPPAAGGFRGAAPRSRFPLCSLGDLHGKLGAMARVVLAWVALFWLTAMVGGLQVTVPDKKKVAMLFQPTVLRCHFSTSSHQPAVVQWKFKSYCQDRMGESLGMSTTRIQSLSKRNLEWDPYLDCLDSRRTVRVVASKQGSTVTLGDFYRGREITIVHDADLQIGKLLWGDSGLYYCIITTPDDLEGKNEDSVELLVLGKREPGATFAP